MFSALIFIMLIFTKNNFSKLNIFKNIILKMLININIFIKALKDVWFIIQSLILNLLIRFLFNDVKKLFIVVLRFFN